MSSKFPLEAWAEHQPGLTCFAFFLIGAMMTLTFAPFGYYLLTPILLLPVLYAFLRLAPAAAARVGASFGAGLFLAGTYWLYVSIHVFGQAPLVLALALMLGLVFIMSLYYAATGWMLARYRGLHLWQFIILAPAVWVFNEWLRGWILSGFPWMTLGYSQIDSTLSPIAPMLGVYGVSLALLISASAFLVSVLSSGTKRIVCLVVALLPWLAGAALEGREWTYASGAAVQTTIVQGGVSQDRKWLPEQFQTTLDLYRDSLLSHGESELVVWPEVAIPSVADQVEGFIRQLESDLRPNRQTLLFGILERDVDAGKVFNSVFAVGDGERQIYRKRHLVPFGEYFPVPDFVREWMRLMNLPYSDISAGNDTQPLLQMADGNRLAVAICYEDAYAAEQLYALPEASILINVSNDAWFGDSIAPHQHLQIARMRALEVGRYVVRATNNGISAFIGPQGELIERGQQFAYVAMTYDVQPQSGSTPFSRLGNWPVVLLATLITAWFGWRSRAQ